jgi:dihydrodipicolinate synthase/N-acetylneuraminate lyase
MTSPERQHAAEIILDQAAGRSPVIVHVGTADASSTVDLASHAARKGASALGVIPPYYYCDHSEFEVLAHFRAVAEAVPLPIFIYENPKYSGISISPQFARTMKEEIPAIRGMKVAYGAGAMLDYIKLFPDDVAVFTGNADIFGLVPFGVAGMINPPTSFVPELCVSLWHALEREDYNEAVQLQRQVNTVTQIVITNIKRYGRATVADTFRMRGIPIKRFPRWETKPLPNEAREAMYQDLKRGGYVE